MTEYLKRQRRKCEARIAKEMEERRKFMKELKDIRNREHRSVFKTIKINVGPAWYQVLTVRHREALDSLKISLYQDILEGQPTLTTKIIKTIGIYPMPHRLDIIHAMLDSKNRPKVFLSQLFYYLYDHAINERRRHYDLNMKLICSSIFYLGLQGMILSLEEIFAFHGPDKSTEKELGNLSEKKARIQKKKENISPYLQEMVATPLWTPAPPKRKPPLPLPDLDFQNQDFDVDVIIPKKKKPKPPKAVPSASPGLPKNRLPRYYCDQIAGIFLPEKPIQKKPTKSELIRKINQPRRRRVNRGSKLSLRSELKEKKVYGIGSTKREKKIKTKPKAPHVGIENTQYLISGVYTVKERKYYIISGLCILPTQGWTIFGGLVLQPTGQYVPLHLGIKPFAEPEDEECGCLEQWDTPVTKHLQKTKCYCGHRYDFKNPGSFSEDEVPFFIKPTRFTPMSFQYNAIYEMEPKIMHVQKEIKKIWDNESILAVDEEDAKARREKRESKKKKQDIAKKSLEFCLGNSPDIEDFLNYALRTLKNSNLASCLPDVHKAPELKEWMRRRIYGPLSPTERKTLMITSAKYWGHLKARFERGFRAVKEPDDPRFSSITTWAKKEDLNKLFRATIRKLKQDMFKAHSNANNILWGTLFHPQFPDKSLREIFFTYLVGQTADVCLARPYNAEETRERAARIGRKRYICLPKGASKHLL